MSGVRDRGSQRAVRFLRGRAKAAYTNGDYAAANALSAAADAIGRGEHFAAGHDKDNENIDVNAVEVVRRR